MRGLGNGGALTPGWLRSEKGEAGESGWGAPRRGASGPRGRGSCPFHNFATVILRSACKAGGRGLFNRCGRGSTTPRPDGAGDACGKGWPDQSWPYRSTDTDARGGYWIPYSHPDSFKVVGRGKITAFWKPTGHTLKPNSIDEPDHAWGLNEYMLMCRIASKLARRTAALQTLGQYACDTIGRQDGRPQGSSGY